MYVNYNFSTSLLDRPVCTFSIFHVFWFLIVDWRGDLMVARFVILAWKNPMDEGAWQATVHGVTRLSDFTSLQICHIISNWFCQEYNNVDGWEYRCSQFSVNIHRKFWYGKMQKCIILYVWLWNYFANFLTPSRRLFSELF